MVFVGNFTKNTIFTVFLGFVRLYVGLLFELCPATVFLFFDLVFCQ